MTSTMVEASWPARQVASADVTDREVSAAGWYPDPTWRYEFRWHNGTAWTADVSVHGQRFVDPLGAAHAAGPPVGFGPVVFGPPPRSDGRGMAIASFVVAASSALIAWVPFVFVLAAMGAVTALVFAVASRRASQAAGRDAHGLAVAGLAVAMIALGLCVVGFQFTRTVMEELDRLAEAGPHRVTLTECRADGRLVAVDGRLTNLDDTTQTFIVELEVSDSTSGTILALDAISTGMVDPGDTATFEATIVLPDDAGEPDDVECTISGVRGPSLFRPNP